MNYGQKRKEDLEAANGWLAIAKKDNNTTAIQILENLFPELRESEDDRIIRCIRVALTDVDEKRFNDYDTTLKDCLTWLEKQDEQKTAIEYIYPRFRIGDVIEPIKPNGYYPPVRVLSIEKKNKSYYCESDDHNHYSSIPIRCEDEYKLAKQGEQKTTDKVESKSAWSEDDERMFSGLISIVEDWYNTMSENEKEYYGDCGYIDWLKSLKDRVQPQQEWSEEDETAYKRIVSYIPQHLTAESYTANIKWLNSIKDRVQLQPKLEWSEEDEKNLKLLNEVIADSRLTATAANILSNWLKSLKPQTCWKPSEEQIKILNEILNFAANHESPYWNDYIFGTLNNLIRQLKKLKGE